MLGLCRLTLCVLETLNDAMANSENSDEMPQNAQKHIPSDCLVNRRINSLKDCSTNEFLINPDN